MHLLIKECHQTKLFFKFSAFNFFSQFSQIVFYFLPHLKCHYLSSLRTSPYLLSIPIFSLAPFQFSCILSHSVFMSSFSTDKKNINLKISFIKTLHSNYNLLSFNLLGISLQLFHENMFWFQLVCFQKFMLKLTNDIEITQ